MSGILVAYFSASGTTAKTAKTIADVTGGELFEICPVQRYTSADLNWNDPKSRSSAEMNDELCRPAISTKVADMASYDTVFIGFPIWWYRAPKIIETFLESYDFSGKTIIAFASSGGSGMGNTENILKKCCAKDARWLSGKRMGSRESTESIQRWISGLSL